MRFLSILLFLILIVPQSAEAQESPLPSNLTVAPKPVFNIIPSVISETIDHGSSSIVNVTVSNDGNVNMTNVTVSKSGSIQDWINLSTTNLDTIIPLDSKKFNVTISVPSGTTGDTYSSEIIIDSNETENVTIPVEVDVPSWGDVTTTPSGNGGNGGNGITVKSTGFYNFTEVVEIHAGSSKTISGEFYSRSNMNNIVFNVTGIDESWFYINPSSLDEIKYKEAVDISITFSIPDYAVLTTHPIKIIAKVGAVKYKKELELIVLAKPETTTTLPYTTTIKTCALAGQACASDLDCCYGYCCDNLCSDEECGEVTGFRTMYIALIVIGITAPTSYYIYKKYYKKKIPVEVKPVISAKAPVKVPTPVVRPRIYPTPAQRPPSEVPLSVKYKRELASLRMIIQKLRVRGYDVTEVEDELSLAENALRENLPVLSITHLNRIKQLLRKK